MSVTIAPALCDSDVLGWGLECACGAARTDVLAATPEAAAALTGTAPAVCGDSGCSEIGPTPVMVTTDHPSVNLNNGNAATVMSALGYTGDTSIGSDDAEAFLGRVLTALAVAPADAGVPAHEMSGGGAPMVACGRPEGYLQQRLQHLHEVAMWAVQRGTLVTWA